MAAGGAFPSSLSAVDSVDFAANVLSSLACIVVLVRVRYVDARIRRRLFMRQMVALATADLLFHLKHDLHYALVSLSMSRGVDPEHQGILLCTFFHVAGRCFMTASAMIEMHIGLAFAFQSLRCQRALAVMSRSLPLCWLVAFLVAAEDLIEGGLTGARCPVKGVYDDKTDYAYASIMILASAVGLAACLLTAYASRGCSDATIKRLMRRVGSLPVSCLLTQIPAAVLKSSTHPDPHFRDFALLSMHINGFANVLAYALQSRYTAHLMGWAAPKAGHDFVRHEGYISQGGDLLRERTTLEAAKRRALTLEGCQGFCFRSTGKEEVEVVFKSKWDVQQGSEPWTAYRLVRHAALADERPEQGERHSFHACFGAGNHVQVEVLLIPNRKAPFDPGRARQAPLGPPEDEMPDVPANLDFAF